MTMRCCKAVVTLKTAGDHRNAAGGIVCLISLCNLEAKPVGCKEMDAYE